MARIRSPDGARYNPLRVVFWHVCGLIHVRARLEWPAKRVHWQDMFGGLLPEGDIVYPRPLFGKAAYLEDREIIFIDSPIAETVHSTAFYEPLKDVPTLNECSAPGDYANQIPTAPAPPQG
jgi:hypothetical protein